MFIYKKTILSLFIIITLLFLALTFLPRSFNFNKFKPQIISAIEEQMGKKIKIDGNIRVNLFPKSYFYITKIKIPNEKGFKDKNILTVDKIMIFMPLSSLWNKKLKLDKFLLSKPNFYLEKKGLKNNWDFLSKLKSKKSGGGNGFEFSSINFSIPNGNIFYKKNSTLNKIEGFHGRGQVDIGEKITTLSGRFSIDKVESKKGLDLKTIEEIDAKGEFALKDKKMYLTGSFSVEKIESVNKESKEEAKKSASENYSNKGWSTKKIKIPTSLAKIEAKINLKINEIKINKTVLEKTELNYASKNKNLKLSGKSQVSRIFFKFKASHLINNPIVLSLSSKIKGENLSNVLSKLGMEQSKKRKIKVEGSLYSLVSINTLGFSLYDFARNANGGLTLDLKQAVLQGFSIREAKKRIENLDNFISLIDFSSRDFFQGQTSIQKFYAKLSLSKGILRSKEISLRSDGASGGGDVLIDIAERYGNIKTDINLEVIPDLPHFKGAWKGSFSDLKFDFNKSDFVTYFTNKSGKVIPNITNPKEILESPVNILKGLKGFFK